MMRDKYETEARAIGTEHGRNAASWVELDEAGAQYIDEHGVFDGLLDGTAGPLSGEWAGYSPERLFEDCGASDKADDRDDLGLTAEAIALQDELATAYEEAYWQAFEAEVLRKVEAMRGPTLALDPEARYTLGARTVAYYYVGQTFGGKARMVMVGDDREWIVDPDDLEVLDEGASCASCGQVGCTADGRSE